MLTTIFKNWLKTRNIDVKEGTYYRSKALGYVHFYYFSKRNKDAATIMYVHGTGNDSLFLTEELFSTLIDAGYNVFTFDLDGHGLKSTTKLSEKSLDSCIEDAYRYLVELTGRVDKLYLMGYSVGGLLSLKEMARQLIPIHKIICMASPFSLSINQRAILKELLSITNEDFFNYAQNWGISALIPAIGPFNRKSYPVRLHRLAANQSPLGYVDFIKSYISSQNWSRITNLANVEILGIYGDDDLIAEAKMAKDFFGQWDRSRLIVLPKINHYLISISRSTITEIKDFLSE